MPTPTTTGSADLLALLEEDPAAGILAAADLREQRAKAADEDMPSPWSGVRGGGAWCPIPNGHMALPISGPHVEHIAAEANPAHALAAVRHWRGVGKRHTPIVIEFSVQGGLRACRGCSGVWPCPDLTETADEARAYLGGAS